MKCQGCDLDFDQRDKVLRIGDPVRGGLKFQSPDLFEDTYRQMNIDLDSKKYQQIAMEITNRP